MSGALHFHLVSFEGPDGYARAGGLAARVDGLTRTLAEMGFETHLWFVGDPELPGHERRNGVALHRWCQWISRHHPAGVYAGEEAKRRDLTASLPRFLLEDHLRACLAKGDRAVVLAEEWHTADAVIALDRELRNAGLRGGVTMLWNANNLFGFDRIDWPGLAAAAVPTTVSRIMRHRMENYGVTPVVIANGLPREAFDLPNRSEVAALRRAREGRLALAKIARWDPDKGWLAAMRAVAHLRDLGLRPLLLARGGQEEHESQVRAEACRHRLRWLDWEGAGGTAAVKAAVEAAEDAEFVSLRFPLDGVTSRTLFRAVDAVLANSRFEPFGLVGLEAMAVGAVACTGLSGEDYAVPGRNALVIQTQDPAELGAVLGRLREHPEEESALRRAARRTARQFAWSEIVKRVLLPRVELLESPANVRR